MLFISVVIEVYLIALSVRFPIECKEGGHATAYLTCKACAVSSYSWSDIISWGLIVPCAFPQNVCSLNLQCQ